MSTFEKLITKIFQGRAISYAEAERLLLCLDFELDISGSHHIFRKKDYSKTLALKRRAELLQYQIKELKKVLEDHNYHEK